jgi:hypothetical protein
MALLVPEFLQSTTYTHDRWKRAYEHYAGALQPGVWNPGDLKVTAAGGFVLNIAAGSSIVSDGSGGFYHVELDSAVTVTAPGGSGGSLYRLDQVCLKINETTNIGEIVVLQGTTGSQSTRDFNMRVGAAALPAGHLRLADIQMVPTPASITDSMLRDRRPWARGANLRVMSTLSTTYTTASSTFADFGPASMAQRIELSGVPTRLQLKCAASHASGSSGLARFRLAQFAPNDTQYDHMGRTWAPDGAQPYLSAWWQSYEVPATATAHDFEFVWTPPKSGSYLYKPQFASDVAANLVVTTSSSFPLEWSVREEPGRPLASTANGSS